MIKQIVPVGSKIKFNTGWVWEVLEDNEIIYPSTGQKSSLLYLSKRDYIVLRTPNSATSEKGKE